MANLEVRRMTIEPGENGGHVVEHEYERPAYDKHPLSYNEPERHVFGAAEDGKMMTHISKTLKLNNEGKGKNDGLPTDPESHRGGPVKNAIGKGRNDGFPTEKQPLQGFAARVKARVQ